jgi:hypothetical protein
MEEVLSNVGLARYDAPARALHEIEQLLQIKKNLGRNTPFDLIKEAESRYEPGSKEAEFPLVLKIDPKYQYTSEQLAPIAISLPTVMHPVCVAMTLTTLFHI